MLLDLGLSTSATAPTPIEATAPTDSSTHASLAPDAVDAPGSPLSATSPQQKNVLCLSCSDGLSAMTAALRMRNGSHAALLNQGFLEPEPKLERGGFPLS